MKSYPIYKGSLTYVNVLAKIKEKQTQSKQNNRNTGNKQETGWSHHTISVKKGSKSKRTLGVSGCACAEPES